jgi:sugar/nucleoside kinase (ribokinase family)
MGRLFESDLASTNVMFERVAHRVEKPTSHNIVLVSPDGRRTINTFMGCSDELESSDLDPELIKAARITYLEGYLLDGQRSREALHSALEIAKSADRQVALGLSHRGIVARYRSDIIDLIRAGVDVLFGNELEITPLYEKTSFGEAAHLAAQDAGLVALTRGRRGSYVLSRTRGIHVPVEPCARIVDITGAGDLYAAGFLMALSEHNSMDLAARLGNAAAGAIIQHLGPRPEKSLADLAHAKGLITEPRPAYSELELFS